MTDKDRLDAYGEMIDRACAMISEQLGADGAWTTPCSSGGYFSLVPLANQLGRYDWSHAVLRYVQGEFVDADGALAQPAKRAAMMAYVPSWFVWGAAEAGWYGLSNTLVEHVASFQSKTGGGLFAGVEEASQQRGAYSYDATTIGAVAFACAGRTDACLRVADFLLRLREVQPEPEVCFYTDWHESDGLVTTDCAPLSALRWAEPKQGYWKMGLFVLAQVAAYRVSGESRYLEAAVGAYRLCTDRAVDLWTNTLSHKMCWAGTRLYAITGERPYLEDACRYADHLVTLQQPDGGVAYPEFWDGYPPDPWESVPNFGCQAVLWVAQTRAALAGSGA